MIVKVFKILLKFVIFILVYLLQIYAINNVNFFGVNGDLCLMAVVITSLIDKNITAYFTAVLCGITSDLLFSPNVLKYVVIYVIVTAILIELKKIYKQDSKLSIIIFSITASVISEIIMAIFMIVTKLEFVNVFSYVFNVLKLCIINVFLAYIVYLALKKCKQEE